MSAQKGSGQQRRLRLRFRTVAGQEQKAETISVGNDKTYLQELRFAKEVPGRGLYRTVCQAHDGRGFAGRVPIMIIELKGDGFGRIVGETSADGEVLHGDFTATNCTTPLRLHVTSRSMECVTTFGQSYDGFQSATLWALAPGQKFAAIPISSEDFDSESEGETRLPAAEVPVLKGDILCTFRIRPLNALAREPDEYTHLVRLLDEDKAERIKKFLNATNPDVSVNIVCGAIGQTLDSIKCHVDWVRCLERLSDRHRVCDACEVEVGAAT